MEHRFHLQQGGHSHDGDDCLSTLRINEHGKMVMAAQEFEWQTNACFLNKLLTHDGMVWWALPTENYD